MNNPDELRTNKDLPIVEGKFLSKEWVDSEDMPIYQYNLNGDQVMLSKFEGEYYLMRKTTKAVAGPIPILESHRK